MRFFRREPRWKSMARRLECVPPTGVTYEGLDLRDWLTQIGERGKFRDRPRFDARPGASENNWEMDVSTTLGKLSTDDAVWQIFRRPTRPKESVRHFIVHELLQDGYVALKTPTGPNPQHTSIWAGLDHADPHAVRLWWEDPERVTLTEVSARCMSVEGGVTGAND